MMRTGGEIVVDYLIKEGIEYVIGIPGHGCLSFFDALRDRVGKGLIKYIQVKQEMCAVHMADGYYRATGKLLAVFASIGPGALNTTIGLGTAYVDSTPVLLIAGDTHTYMRGAGVLQEIEKNHDSDFLSCIRPITKRCWRVENIFQLPKIMQRAFNEMLTGRKGPVAISIPMDIQAHSIDIELPEPCERRTCSLMYGDPDYVKAACDLMRTAARPVILAGGGALYADCSAELVRLAETWGAAVVTTMAGKSAFPEDHPLYGWHGGSKGTDVGNYLCSTADVVLSLGCRFADETTSSYKKGVTYNFPETRLIQVDIDHQEIGKNYPCSVGIIGDVKAVINQMLSEFEKDGRFNSYRESVYFKDMQRAKKEWFETLTDIRNASGDQLTISKFIQTVNSLFPVDGLIVTSSGNSQAQIFQEYCFKGPRTHITTGGFSTMGFALPAGLGVKLSRPDKPVLVITGDGDFMMTMQELSTAVQYNIPVIIAVLNNIGWMAIKDLQADVFGSGMTFGNDFEIEGNGLYSPDFCALARSMGVEACHISAVEEIEPVISSALKSDKPILVEVSVSREYPHSGGISTGWWDVPIPEYMVEKSTSYLMSREQEDLK